MPNKVIESIIIIIVLL